MRNYSSYTLVFYRDHIKDQLHHILYMQATAFILVVRAMAAMVIEHVNDQSGNQWLVKLAIYTSVDWKLINDTIYLIIFCRCILRKRLIGLSL